MPYYNKDPQKGTLILTTTHMLSCSWQLTAHELLIRVCGFALRVWGFKGGLESLSSPSSNPAWMPPDGAVLLQSCNAAERAHTHNRTRQTPWTNAKHEQRPVHLLLPLPCACTTDPARQTEVVGAQPKEEELSLR